MQILEPLLGEAQGLPYLLRLGDVRGQQGPRRRHRHLGAGLQLAQQEAQFPDQVDINCAQGFGGFLGGRGTPAGRLRPLHQSQG